MAELKSGRGPTTGVRADDVLRHNVKLLTLGGAWPPSERRGLRRLFPLYTATIYFCQSATIAMGIWLTYDLWGDVDEIMLTYVNTFTLLGGYIKLIYFSRDVRGYRELVSILRDVAREQWPYCENDAKLMSIFTGAYRKGLWLTFGPLVYLNILGPTWFFMPLILRAFGSEERLLPFVNLRESVTNIFPLYVAIYVVQVYCMFFWNIISVGLDMFFVTSMVHVAAQLKILNERLSNLGEDPPHDDYGAVLDRQIMRGFVNPQKRPFSCDRRRRDMYEELRNCIKTHQHILSSLKKLQRVMSPVAMTQFMCSASGACITLFQATFNPEGNSTLKCLIFLPLPAFQIFIYCWAGHEIVYQEELLSVSGYGSAWVGASRRISVVLHILMCNAQKPLRLTAGKFYPVNRDTFVTLINASYTFYTLMRQTRDQGSTVQT
ncbi:odorant receptor Or2-like [Schistocerca serialis cubense]|uniref:odorant receptor Or2-like n=3 Tax=Schistocerca TaxID=7008 RepID=UPI00214E1BFB|nr:odorant receptor Or2-like [Schistocerca serialis cubense]